jgi:hypothetical protein
MHEVIITVRTDGQTTVEANGIKGAVCTLKTAPYVKALGKQTGQAAKPEMYETETTTSSTVNA